MRYKELFRFFFIFIILLFNGLRAFSQSYSTTSWQEAKKNKQANIKIYYYAIDGFVKKSEAGLEGIEYEFMEDFLGFVDETYQIETKREYVEVDDFPLLYEKGKKGSSGEFFMASFSITPERLKEVKFSPAFIPDIEVMISTNDLPVVKDTAEFIKYFEDAKGLTVRKSTFEATLLDIKENYLPNLEIEYVQTFDEVRQRMEKEDKLFGYTQLVGYLLRKRSGIDMTKQNVFKVSKTGIGILHSKSSDWDEPFNSYIKTQRFKNFINQAVRKYLGYDIEDFLVAIDERQYTRNSDEIKLLTQEREEQLQNLKSKEIEILEKNNQILYTSVGIVVISIIILLLYLRYLTKRKNNIILQEKNDQIELQRSELIKTSEELKSSNKMMLDSIQVAKGIQQALLPHQEKIPVVFKESFMIYEPKDIVSGDFYWVGELDRFSFVVLIDCEGRGVPGAFMTTISYSLLNEVVFNRKISDPNKILKWINEDFESKLPSKSETKTSDIKITVCVIEHSKENDTINLSFASQNQHLFVYNSALASVETHNGTNANDLGASETNKITLESSDVIYLSTDGFVNAISASIESKELEEVLVQNGELPMEAQKTKFHEILSGSSNNLEQLDDALFVGLRVK